MPGHNRRDHLQDQSGRHIHLQEPQQRLPHEIDPIIDGQGIIRCYDGPDHLFNQRCMLKCKFLGPLWCCLGDA